MSKIKKIFLYIILFIIILGISLIAVIYIKNEKMVAILGYHDTLLRKDNINYGNLTVDVEKFEEQIKILKKLNYKTLGLDEFYCWKQKKCKKPHKSVLITFDDGYYGNYKYAFDILKKYDMKATMFVVGELVEKNEYKSYIKVKDLKRIKKMYPNIEIASHTYSLHNPDYKNYKKVDSDCKKMRKLIKTKYFAYPHGIYNSEYIKALKDNNFKMAFTYGPGKEHRKAKIIDDEFKIPRLSISNDMSNLKFILRIILPI